MNLQALPLPYAAGAIPGLSERLMSSHHHNNYGGAVKRLNAIRAQLAATSFASTPGFVLNGLKREELIATNSMLLHELYFASLGGDGQTMEPAMRLALEANFGGLERWREQFGACAKALGGGSGWVLLVFNPREGTLVNQWSADHTHALASGAPLMALDMYEHAYHLDFGTNAAAYVDACLAAIDWGGVYARYKTAVHAASEGFGADHDDIANSRVLDVRRAGIFEQVTTQLPGAAWCDPAAVAQWADQVPRDRPVIVYCVYGHEVGRATALRLRASGVDARYLRGGIDGWSDAGKPVEPRRDPP
ncbi:Fe-Mn family superoxide dismutase [Hydrogenophaga sp.]